MMHYFLHFTDNIETPLPQEITEQDGRLLLEDYYPKQEARDLMWGRLQGTNRVDW